MHLKKKKKIKIFGIAFAFFFFLLAVVFGIDMAVEQLHREKKMIEKRELLESSVEKISDYARELYDLKSSYIKSESDYKELLSVLGIEKFGKYTIETKMKQEDFILVLHFKNTPDDLDDFNSKMIGYANILLALIGNVIEIDWTYPTEESISTGDESLAAFVAWKTQETELILDVKSVKEFGESEEKVQELLDRCGYIGDEG